MESFKDIMIGIRGTKGVKMFQKHKEDIHKAQHHSDLLEIIYNYMSWYNYELLKHVMELCTNEISIDRSPAETDRNMAKFTEIFSEYESKLVEYYRRRVFECPQLSGVRVNEEEYLKYFVLKVDKDFKHLTLGELHDHIQPNLQIILEIYPHALHLRSVNEGCTELVYIIPRCLHEAVFPLSKEQWQELLALGVTNVWTDGYERHCDLNQVRRLMCGVD